jgi:hypothetical protein
VADMLMSMDEQVKKHQKEIRSFHVSIEQCNTRVNQVNAQLEREAKLKDMIELLKARISAMVSFLSTLCSLLTNIILSTNRTRAWPETSRRLWKTMSKSSCGCKANKTSSETCSGSVTSSCKPKTRSETRSKILKTSSTRTELSTIAQRSTKEKKSPSSSPNSQTQSVS